MFLGRIQDHHHLRNARHVKRLSVHLVGEILRHPRREKGTKHVGVFTTVRETLCTLHHFLKIQVEPLYIRATLGHAGANIQPTFFSLKIIEK